MLQLNIRNTMARRLLCVAGLGAGTLLAGSAQAVLVQTINYSNFNDVSALARNGDSVQSPGLSGEQNTLTITPPSASASGSVYYTQQQQVTQGFVTDFKFRMRDRQGAGSDGLTFVIQNQSVNAIGAAGGAMGYATNLAFPSIGQGITKSIAIAFDTWDNSTNWSSIAGNNVLTVQAAGNGSNEPDTDNSLGGVNVSGAFNDGSIHQVRISYVPGVLEIFYDNLGTPALTINNFLLDNQPGLNGLAWVGFTAASGGAANVQRHEIIDWSFSSGAIPAPTAAGLLAMGGLMASRRRR